MGTTDGRRADHFFARAVARAPGRAMGFSEFLRSRRWPRRYFLTWAGVVLPAWLPLGVQLRLLRVVSTHRGRVVRNVSLFCLHSSYSRQGLLQLLDHLNAPGRGA